MVQQSRNFRNSYSDIIYRITGKAPIHHTLYSSPLMNLHVYFSLVVTQPLDLHYTCDGPSSKYHTGVKRQSPQPTQPTLHCAVLVWQRLFLLIYWTSKYVGKKYSCT